MTVKLFTDEFMYDIKHAFDEMQREAEAMDALEALDDDVPFFMSKRYTRIIEHARYMSKVHSTTLTVPKWDFANMYPTIIQ